MNPEDKITILFQGDSITDADRNKEDGFDLGHGYAMMAASMFISEQPERNIQFLNRGISGNRVIDLKNRWEEDCTALYPSVVSIFVGINDCWRRYDDNDPISIETFRNHYKDILLQVKDKTNAKIIIVEPFVLPYPEDRIKWREDLDPKINVIRELAREFDAHLLPLDGIMNQASVYREPSFWAGDGVHPSYTGHMLIAKEWLKILHKIVM
ncbi:SGNH/GDSL hydrolase family protein [Agarivorans sp. MS3-6]|uniref:SGNH/GDSL hydrolase family protein n=1 Tax=Agarivorans sp. TSD2052 TaxID=2937286 RepID=UPI00200F781F|nr:SGNH/GDSL hydrolase family protein [Agarivorans sp. TSD2052]UPW16824.1 SGNH/GDSL hydrolase family protein [Agarivorans sp. TSD2052]